MRWGGWDRYKGSAMWRAATVIGGLVLLTLAPALPATARDAGEIESLLRDRGYRDIRINGPGRVEFEVSACRGGDRYDLRIDYDGRVVERRLSGPCEEPRAYYRPPYRDYRSDDGYRDYRRDYGYRDYRPEYGYRSYAPSFDPDDEGYVREVQRLLNRWGYGVSIDGVLGPETRDAVRDFQRRRGLADDGEHGPQTFAELRSRI